MALHGKWSSGDLILYDGTQDILTIKDGTDGIEFGETGYGVDVKFWGATAGTYMLWDASADDLVFSGTGINFSVGSNADTSGSGTELERDSVTAAFRIYADDGGDALYGSGSVPDLRATLSRLLITADQTGGNVRLWGHLGMVRNYDALWNGEQVGGVCGRLELVQSAGTVTLAGYGISAGVTGILATAGTVLVDTYHIAAALAAIADIKGTVTQTGIVAGLYVGKYDTTNWSDATARADWKYGVYIQGSSVVKGFWVGEDADAAGSGIALAGAAWTTAQGNAFYCDDGGVALVGYTEAFTTRMLTTVAVTSGDVSTTAFHSDLTLNANYTGTGGLSSLWGNTTIKTGKTINLSSSLGDVGGATFGIDIVGTNASSSHACGCSVGASVSGTQSGILTGYRIRRQTGAGAWSGAFSLPNLASDSANGCVQAGAATGGTSQYLKVYLGTVLYTIQMTTGS